MTNVKTPGWYLIEGFHPFVKLAYASIYSFIPGRKTLDLANIPPELSQALEAHKAELARRAACFVSLKLRGQLRGCIGTIEPLASNLAEEIVQNAISASTRDPRFPQVDSSELPRLDVSVDVLSEPRVAEETELDPKRYGLIIEQEYRRGVLLPDLEGVNDATTQKRIVAQKGGIDLRRPHKLFIFTVDRYV
jgi:AmmeMemoRadiSam system protein A